MKITYAEECYKQFQKLPSDIQHIFRHQETIFRDNWRDPRLHTKKLKGESTVFSFRITRAYRALFIFIETNSVLMITIGHRKEVYR